MSDKSKVPESVEVNVDPSTTSLEDLLHFAEENRTGTMLVKGELEDGTCQWGIVVICGENSSEIVKQLSDALDEALAKILTRTAN